LIQPISTFLSNLSYVLVAIVGGLQVASGQLSLGNVQAFIQYSRQFNQPISQLASMVTLFQSALASAERVFELLDEEEERADDPSSIKVDRVEGRVEFDSVDFSYDKSVELIKDFNLKVKKGETIAIVGPTGAGKTTLVNLIMRFYDVDKGSISIDDIGIMNMSRHDLRKNVGMVLQDTWLFNGTVEENLRYGLHEGEDISDEEFARQVQATQIDSVIRKLPDGYDTIVSNENETLSQGERQLLTIARASLANPDILILDEATSSVDTRTEVLVQAAMKKLQENRTSFVIAHRLSTIRNADTILLLENGRITEQGNHDELMALNGEYSRLYNSQFELS
jgi:ATP-binding cassette subfamily B protein